MQLQVLSIGRVSATGSVFVGQRNRKSYRYRNERMVHNVELTLGFVTIDLMILSEILSIKNMRHIWTEMNLYYLLYCF